MKGKFYEKIYVELTHLLYKQVVFALWGETFAALGVFIALWPVKNHTLIATWFLSNLIICSLGRHILIFLFNHYSKNKRLSVEAAKSWVTAFTIGALLSGISWGIAGGVLINGLDIVRESFMVFILIGITAGANPFYSPFSRIYCLFLATAFIPFGGWLLSQGGILAILSIMTLIYMAVMIATSIYTQNLLSSSLQLSFENVDLVNDLARTMTAFKQGSHELEQSFSTLQATLESTTDGILAVDDKGHIVNFNQKFLEMWNVSHINLKSETAEKMMLQHAASQLIDPLHFIAKTKEMTDHPEVSSYDEIHFIDGRIFERYSNPQYLANKCVGRVISFRDITGRKLMENKLYNQANYDVLTNLPNRALARDRLSQAISYAKRYSSMLGVLFLDLDRFKLINDTLGHTIGDKLLKEVAVRLKACVRESDTVSREGGDEFLIIITNFKHEDEISQIARTCREELSKDFIIDDNKVASSVSIGISVYPKDGEDAEMLIRNADIAMYKVKEISGNDFAFYTDEMNQHVQRRTILENTLRGAIENKELFLLYQPIIDLKTGKISTLEALLRWKNEKLGLISPNEFIPIAEESDLIIPIGEWAIVTACEQVKSWQDKFKHDIGLNVNISLRQLRQPTFLENVGWILHRAGLKPQLLSLELTESVAMDDVQKNIAILRELKKFGVSLVIDDFGTGYSSLNYLKQLPVNKLKIDKAFIQGIPEHADDAAITSAIIALAQQLMLKVIAEGVTSKEQAHFLAQMNCDEGQGYYFAEPLDTEQCEQFLREKFSTKEFTP